MKCAENNNMRAIITGALRTAKNRLVRALFEENEDHRRPYVHYDQFRDHDRFVYDENILSRRG